VALLIRSQTQDAQTMNPHRHLDTLQQDTNEEANTTT
jgi:hypothetical protein